MSKFKTIMDAKKDPKKHKFEFRPQTIDKSDGELETDKLPETPL